MCNPNEINDSIFKYKYTNVILDRTDTEIDENQSDCSRKTLRTIKVFVKDERDMLNTKLSIPVELEETNDLRLDNPDLDELDNLDLDYVKIDTESLDEVDNDNDDKREDKDDNKDNNDDDSRIDDEEFTPSTVSITILNESKSLECDPHTYTDIIFILLQIANII